MWTAWLTLTVRAAVAALWRRVAMSEWDDRDEAKVAWWLLAFASLLLVGAVVYIVAAR